MALTISLDFASCSCQAVRIFQASEKAVVTFSMNRVEKLHCAVQTLLLCHGVTTRVVPAQSPTLVGFEQTTQSTCVTLGKS